jgi:methyl-accepting chemotaxis protein
MKKTKNTIFTIGIAFIIFLLFVPIVSYTAFKLAIKEKTFNHLITTRELLVDQIENYFYERLGDVNVLAENPTTAQALSSFAQAFKDSGIKSAKYAEIADTYQPLMNHYVSNYGYTNIFLVDISGDVIFSAKEDEYTGINLLTTENSRLKIAKIFKKGMEEITFDDYTWHHDEDDFVAYFASPVYDNKVLVGVLLTEIPFSHLDAMLSRRKGLGETGEMYLVGKDGLMRSNSRFSEETTVLKKKVDTEATRDAFYGNAGTQIIDDYRGVPVLSAYTPLNFKTVDWVLLVEIDKKEAFETIRTVEIKLLVIALSIGAITMIYLYLKSKSKDLESIEESKTC